MSIPSNYPSPFEDNNIDLLAFKKKTAASDFYDSLPPDAKFQFFQDGTSGFVDGRGNKYTPPPSIDDRPRNVSPNTDTIQYNRFNTSTSNTSSSNITQGNETVESSTTSESGSDFLTNVGGAGATTFDYDLSEPDLLEAIELRKSAYGENLQIQTSSTINAAGEEEKTFLERTGDRLYEIFVSGPMSVETKSSPVSGKTVATKVPGIAGVADSATALSGIPFGQIMNKMGDRFIEKQTVDTEAAVVGMTGYGAVQVQEKSTGRIIDLTTSPAFGKGLDQSANRTAFMNALGITDNTSVGTYAESDVQGPVIFNGIEYPNINAVIAVVSRQGYVSPFAMEANIPAGEDYDRSRVVGAGEKRIGLYDEDSGEINLGFGRTGAVTGVALDGSGNLNYKTDGSGFVMGMGEMVNTGTGIAYGGSRANIAGANALSQVEAQDLLSKINNGEITSTPNTTNYLSSLAFSGTFQEDTNVGSPIFGTVEPLSPVTVEELPTGDDFINQMEDQVDADTYQMQEATLPSTTINNVTPIQQYNTNTGDDNNNDDDGADPSSMGDSGFGGGGGFATAMGGRIGKQEGGVANQQGVSQIVQGAGFIAPQGSATEQQTIADDIPLEAEEGDFIINAPAAQFAGRQDIVTMITEAIDSLREKGVDIQYGDPKIPVEKSVKLAVSRNEVYVPKLVAEEIGYDKLQKINKRGQKEVQRRQEEAQGQAARGGFVKKADGDVVTQDETLAEDKSSMMGTDEGNFIQNLGRAVYDNIKKDVSGFIAPKEKEKKELKTLEESKVKPSETEKVGEFPEPPPSRPEQQYFGLSYPLLVKALERVETGDVLKNVQIRDKFKENPYRFTEVTIKGPEGSSAFGLRQLTYTAMQDLLDNNIKNLSKEEINYATKFIDMGKQRVNLENSKGNFIYEGPKDDRIKVSALNKARKLGMSLAEYKTRLGVNGGGLIPEAQHKKYYNKFADMFFKSKLNNSKSLEEGVGNYYSKTKSSFRKNYVEKFKDALKQIDAGVILNKIEPDSKKYIPIPKLKPKNSFLSPTMG